MIEHFRGMNWAHCSVARCRWEGPMRFNGDSARDDELDHLKKRHPKAWKAYLESMRGGY